MLVSRSASSAGNQRISGSRMACGESGKVGMQGHYRLRQQALVCCYNGDPLPAKITIIGNQLQTSSLAQRCNNLIVEIRIPSRVFNNQTIYIQPLKSALNTNAMIQHALDVGRNILGNWLEILALAKPFEIAVRLTHDIPFQPGIGIDEFRNNQHIDIDATVRRKDTSKRPANKSLLFCDSVFAGHRQTTRYWHPETIHLPA